AESLLARDLALDPGGIGPALLPERGAGAGHAGPDRPGIGLVRVRVLARGLDRGVDRPVAPPGVRAAELHGEELLLGARDATKRQGAVGREEVEGRPGRLRLHAKPGLIADGAAYGVRRRGRPAHLQVGDPGPVRRLAAGVHRGYGDRREEARRHEGP